MEGPSWTGGQGMHAVMVVTSLLRDGVMVGIKLRVIADSFGSYRDQTDPIKR